MNHPESEKPDAVSKVDPADAVPSDEIEPGHDESPPPPAEGPGLETEPDVDDSEQAYGA